MTEEQFWKYFDTPIAKGKSGFWPQDFANDHIRFIKDDLAKRGVDGIFGFYKILCEKPCGLYIPKIGELFLLSAYDYQKKKTYNVKYISTDGFLDFRAWIISLGKEHYLTFLNFESESELLEYDLNPNYAYREDLATMVFELYRELDLEEKNIPYQWFSRSGNASDLFSKMEWDSVDEKYPMLFVKWQSLFN